MCLRMRAAGVDSTLPMRVRAQRARSKRAPRWELARRRVHAGAAARTLGSRWTSGRLGWEGPGERLELMVVPGTRT